MTSGLRLPAASCALVATLGFLAGGCGEDAPRVDEVVPRVVEERSAAEIVVRGAGFHWKYDSLSNTVSGSFKVRANDTPLEDVTWIDATELRARMPAAVRAGRYSISVDGPLGSDTREDGLLVSASAQADAGAPDGGS